MICANDMGGIAYVLASTVVNAKTDVGAVVGTGETVGGMGAPLKQKEKPGVDVCPDGQLTHDEEPDVLYLPAAQSEHEVAPVEDE